VIQKSGQSQEGGSGGIGCGAASRRETKGEKQTGNELAMDANPQSKKKVKSKNEEQYNVGTKKKCLRKKRELPGKLARPAWESNDG